jgi:hypothetical protein
VRAARWLACGAAVAWGGAAARAVTIERATVDVYEVFTELTLELNKPATFSCEPGAEPGTLVLTVAAEAAPDLAFNPAGKFATAKVSTAGGATTFILRTTADAGTFRAYGTAKPPGLVVDVYRRLALGPPRPAEPFRAFLGDRPVLLVDDDDGPGNGNKYSVDVDGVYERALKKLGVKYEWYVVRTGRDGPGAAALAPYPMVVWFTGLDARPAVITAADEAALAAYLDGGGRVVLISQNYLSDSSSNGRSALCRGALGIAGVEADTHVKGVRATPAAGLGEADYNLETDLTIIGNWGDAFQAAPDAAAWFTGTADGKTYAELRRAGAGRVVFCSFAVENVGYTGRLADIFRVVFNGLAAD